MKSMPDNLEQMMNSPEAAKLLKNKEAIAALISSPDAQKFMQLLQQKGDNQLKTAANAALKGDTSHLAQLVNDLSKNPEGARAMQNLNQKLPK